MKEMHIWDLDGTVIDSSHITRVDDSGTFDLDYWVDNSTLANINKDTLLPHANHYIDGINNPDVIVVVATARAMSVFDIAYINDNLGKPDYFVYRLGNDDRRSDHDLKVDGMKKILAKYTDIGIIRFWDDNLTNIKKVNNLIYEDLGMNIITCHVNCENIDE